MSLEQRANFSDVDASPRKRFLTRLVSRFLPRVQYGQLTLRLPSGDAITCGHSNSQPAALVEIHRWRTLFKLALHGDAGFANAYETGDVSVHDLSTLFDFVLRNRSALDHSIAPSTIGLLLSRLKHGLRGNSRKGSRKNISAHYDLGNDFYRAWLDEGMNYSSGLFASEGLSLEAAQQAKIGRIVELLQPKAETTILEIGCGWGALMEELTCGHRCKVTGITLSREQASYTQHRLSGAVSDGRAFVEIKDYRDCTEKYDRVVSVEMIEAVGEAYWPKYFEKLRHCLVRDGIAVIQAITIAEERFEAYRKEPDFIQQRIFPGGMLPTVNAIKRHAQEAGFDIMHMEFFGDSYAQTLAEWRRRFNRAWPKVRPLGFDQRFKRLWNYYLVYCEAGFRYRATDVGVYVFRPMELPNGLK